MTNKYIVYKHTCPNGKVYIGITGTTLETIEKIKAARRAREVRING